MARPHRRSLQQSTATDSGDGDVADGQYEEHYEESVNDYSPPDFSIKYTYYAPTGAPTYSSGSSGGLSGGAIAGIVAGVVVAVGVVGGIIYSNNKKTKEASLNEPQMAHGLESMLTPDLDGTAGSTLVSHTDDLPGPRAVATAGPTGATATV